MDGLTEEQRNLADRIREEIASPDTHGTTAIASLGLQPGMRVLDFGCGPGNHLGMFADLVGEGGQVVGADISEDGKAVARHLWQDRIERGQIAVHRLDDGALPFEDGTFDLSWSSLVFHHLADPHDRLRELVRVTRPGGRIALFDVDMGSAFPNLTWSPEVEERVRAASWRAAAENYGGSLPYFYEPFFGRRLRKEMIDAGLGAVHVQAIAETVQAPLSAHREQALQKWFTDWFNGRLRPFLTPYDHEALISLFDPEQPGYLLAQPEFFMTRTWLLCVGKTPTTR